MSNELPPPDPDGRPEPDRGSRHDPDTGHVNYSADWLNNNQHDSVRLPPIPPATTANEDSTMTTALPASERIRVLIADDHRLFAELLEMALSRHPRIEVVGVAHDGREALELATAHAPDVTLMDILMPVMDGIEATRRLLELQPSAHVIVVTGVETQENFARAREAGAARCVTKQGLASQLVATIVEVAARV